MAEQKRNMPASARLGNSVSPAVKMPGNDA